MERHYSIREDHTPEQDVSFPYCFLLRSLSSSTSAMMRWARQMDEIADWCTEQFGSPSHQLDDGRGWFHTSGCYRFKNQDDAFAFKVRWF